MGTVEIGTVVVFDNPEATKEQALKILEESAETVEEVKRWLASYPDNFHRIVYRDRISDEIADVIQACANLIAALGVEDFTSYMEDCKQRNINRGRITVEEPEPELKPCPFCGSEAGFEKNTIDNAYFVSCENIECPINIDTGYYETKTEAAEAWNTRAGE